MDMPEMNGIETLERIRKTHARLPVIAFSTQTMRGAKVTLEALSKGATDYVTKPSSRSGGRSALETIRQELIPKIKTFGSVGEAQLHKNSRSATNRCRRVQKPSMHRAEDQPHCPLEYWPLEPQRVGPMLSHSF